jgi:predicted amidohydrolase
VLFDRDGVRGAVYRKHHLFGYESAEAELLVPGESLGLAGSTSSPSGWRPATTSGSPPGGTAVEAQTTV